MAISKDRIRSAREAFRKAKVMLLTQLTALLLCSRRSAQRRLAEWGAITSYNHNSRYYALPKAAQFDDNGIWCCEGVFFSRAGTLKRTVSALIDASDKGLTAVELSTRLHLNANRFLYQWIDEKLFIRERHEGVYRYFSADLGQARKQRQLFLASLGHKPGDLPDAAAVPILLARLHHPTANMGDLARILSSRDLGLTGEAIADFLQFHGLQKKNGATLTRELLADNEALCKLLGDNAQRLTLGERRRFKAGIVNALGEGAQRWAETVLGWSRTTIRKGQRELATSNMIDPCYRGGRPRAEEILPTLLEDITAIVTPNPQQDPTFRTTHTYRRITAATVHEELLAKPGYAHLLPCVRTISTKLNELDFAPTRVAKSKPIKKIAETDAIFDHLHQVNAEADGDDEVLRISIDAKAAIKVGPFSRGGLNRCGAAACDHDFAPLCVLQLFGLFIPRYDENFFFFNESRCTADLVVDCLEHVWATLRRRYQSVKRLVINLDNGPEVQSRRTWFIKRIVDFAHSARIDISLAYYFYFVTFDGSELVVPRSRGSEDRLKAELRTWYSASRSQ